MREAAPLEVRETLRVHYARFASQRPGLLRPRPVVGTRPRARDLFTAPFGRLWALPFATRRRTTGDGVVRGGGGQVLP